MDEDRVAPNRYGSWIQTLLLAVISVSLTAASVYYQRPNEALCGRLGAGFPVAFICDASGESPPGSWGRIDWADLDSLNALGSLLDLLFYGLLFRGAAIVVQRAYAHR
jgi:hypothetical protein